MTPITINHSEKPQTIGLDSSTRDKIVIRAKPPTPKRHIGSNVSIFSPNSRQFSNLSAPPLKTPVQGLGTLVPLPQPTQPSPPTPKMLPKSKTVEDSIVEKHRITPHPLPTAAFPERKIIPLPSKLRISSTSSSVTPTPGPEIVKVTPLSTSQYAEEYDKCPCAKGRGMGMSPCDRCQLMLLADKFCELIDVQCQKWGIPPKH